MRIWVDADACPNPIKEILFRAAERLKIQLTLVANKPLRTPPSAYINTIQVAAGFDMADDKIAQEVRAGDLVVTADIPLAAAALAKGGRVLDPRGEIYTRDNIEARLAMRKFMDELRASGVDTDGPSPFSQGDRQAFARQLERLLAQPAAAEFAPKPPAAGA
ncbi:MAG TPA: YaiI/YqxD family protein [Burkholderiales bacterium]|nr:YaiI/YqxD family protein [Burkholderiales bacterium]